MAKLTIVSKTPFQKEDWNGFIYIAFQEAIPSQPFQFSSKKDHPVSKGRISYDPSANEEVKLRIKLWDGKVKFSEE